MNLSVKYILATLLLIAIQSCNDKENSPNIDTSSEVDVVALDFDMPQDAISYELSSRGSVDQPGRTYRVLLFNPRGYEEVGIVPDEIKSFTGTYYDNDDLTKLLSPWPTDTLGAITTDTWVEKLTKESPTHAGCYAPTNPYGSGAYPYQMVLVSPALNISNPKSDVIYGFYTYRKPKSDTDTHQGRDHVYISRPFTITITGRGAKMLLDDCTGYMYRDTIHVNQLDYYPDIPGVEYEEWPEDYSLKERRSKVRFRIKRGEDITSATVTDVTLCNVIQEAWYNPLDRDYFFSGSESAPTENGVSENNKGEKFATGHLGDVTLWEADDPDVGYTLDDAVKVINAPSETLRDTQDTYTENSSSSTADFVYILSEDYGSDTDVNGSFIHPLPRLKIGLLVNGVKMSGELVLKTDFLPHYHYTFDVAINSIVTKVTLTAEKWDSSVHSSATIDEPVVTDLGYITLDNWNTVDMGSSVIE